MFLQELLFGTGIAHSVMVLSFVIGIGIWLGRYKIKGISIGVTWILFVSIAVSHFGFRIDPMLLSFLKDFGMVLFIFAVGLQAGPGFFHAFRKEGLTMNLLAVMMVALTVLVTCCIHWIFGEDLTRMVGVMSGAVTNTPGLGAAQQTMSDVMIAQGSSVQEATKAAQGLASGYAMAYPMGILGIILVLMFIRSIYKIDIDSEKAQMDAEENDGENVRRMHCEVENPAIFGKTVSELMKGPENHFVIARYMRGGQIFIPNGDTVLHQGDKLMIVTSSPEVDSIRDLFGTEIPMHIDDWHEANKQIICRRLDVTKSEITGKSLGALHLRTNYGVNVTRVMRSGIQLVARPNLRLQMGDSIQIAGSEKAIHEVAELVGNKPETLNHPNLVPIFLGIVVGVLIGSIPIKFPGIPQSIKLGLTGGALIVSIILGHFGPKWHISTYTTLSANMTLRDIGLDLFLAAVGLGAGETFVEDFLNGGWVMIFYGAAITIIPILVGAMLARSAFKMNFYRICGLLCGANNAAPVLGFTDSAYGGTDYPAMNYATVYPLSLFLRVIAAQLMILIAM